MYFCSFYSVFKTQIQESVMKKLNKIITQNTMLAKTFVAITRPHASSNTSLRIHHQNEWKRDLRIYYQCTNPVDPNTTKCMLLNTFFPASSVTAAHIIGLNYRNNLTILGLVAEDVWNVQNGLLLLRPIEKRFDNLEVVSSSF